MTQLPLTRFYAQIVRHVYVPITHPYAETRGLSEARIKRRLERQGWSVWRGGLIGAEKDSERYPVVQRRYALLRTLLEAHHPEHVDELEYLCKVHHGMPDFLCYRRGAFKFVECKLGHEQLSERQKHCIRRLQLLGCSVEVHKLAFCCTKARAADVDLITGEKEVHEKQERLRARYLAPSA